jgi:hypothetical protein
VTRFVNCIVGAEGGGMTDASEYEFYDEPANREAGPGTGVKRPGRGLVTHVPVRFSPEMVAAVRALADEDGVSVSTWIRNVVGREVQRRTPPTTSPGNRPSVVIVEYHEVPPQNATTASTG